MQEQWKPIKGYEGLYEVSNLGRIKSLGYSYIGSNQYGAKTHRIIKPCIKKTRINNNGYERVSLTKERKAKEYFVHRLVAIAFIDKTDDKNVVNHKDFNRTNNKAENLEWVTSSENTLYSYKKGRFDVLKEKLREKYGKPIIGINLKTGLILALKTMKDANRFGFTHQNVQRCCAGKTAQHKGFVWRYVSDEV